MGKHRVIERMISYAVNVTTKVEYDSQTENFIFSINKTFKIPKLPNRYKVHKDHLLFLKDFELRKSFTNLVDLKTFCTFGLIYEEAFKESELFAYLVNEKTIPTYQLKSTVAITSFFFP